MLDIQQARKYKDSLIFEDAIKYYEKYIQSNDVVSSNIIREYCDCLVATNRAENLAKAENILKKLMDDGDALAAGRLGNFYRDGLGGKVNIEKAIAAYKVGASQKWIRQELLKLLLKHKSFQDVLQIDDVQSLFQKEHKEFLDIEITLRRDKVRSELKVQNKNIKCRYNLYRYGKLIKSITNTSSIVDWTIEDTGLYRIAGLIIGTNKVFNSQIFFKGSAVDELDFEKFLTSDIDLETINSKIPFYKLNQPYKDFGVIINKKNDKLTLALNENLEVIEVAKEIYIVGVNVDDLVKNNNIVMSGYCHYDDKLVWGNDNINRIDTEHIRSKTGTFSCLTLGDSYIEICSDIFGLTKIFYYVNDDCIVATNRYILLLYLIQKLNIPIEINKEYLLYSLSLQNEMLTDQPISQEGMVKDVFFLRAGEYIKIDKNNRNFEIANRLEAILSEQDDKYSALIEKAAVEIKNNVRCYLNSNRFSNFVADLTGGFDSRLVFAAITNMHNAEKHFKLLCGGSEREIKCACNIASAFNYEFDKVYPAFRRIRNGFNVPGAISAREYLDLLVSCDIGTCFDSSTTFPVLTLDGYCHITGCCGESCTRPYMSLRFFNIDKKDDEKVIKEYYAAKADRATLSGDNLNIAIKFLKKNIHSDLDFPHNYERLLLQYRSRFHFDSSAKISFSIPCLSPLQSIYGFVALYKYGKQNYKVAFDILKQLNNNLSNFEFESIKDNLEAALYSGKERLITIGDFSSNWVSAQNSSYPFRLIENKSLHDVKNNDTYMPFVKFSIPRLLLILFKNHLLDEAATRDLYFSFKNLNANNQNRELLSLYMKLASAYYIDRISKNGDFDFIEYVPVQISFNNNNFVQKEKTNFA